MKKKIQGLLILLGVYLLALGLGIVFFKIFINHLYVYVSLLLSNVIATIVVWLFGVVFKTASVYDPYWSLQTVCSGLGLMIYYKNFNLGNIVFLVVISLWAIRLT